MKLVRLLVTIIFIALCVTILTACGECNRAHLDESTTPPTCNDPKDELIHLCIKTDDDSGDTHYTCCDNAYCFQIQ